MPSNESQPPRPEGREQVSNQWSMVAIQTCHKGHQYSCITGCPTCESQLGRAEAALTQAQQERDRQYEFNIGQIAKQAELEQQLAQAREALQMFQAYYPSGISPQLDAAYSMARAALAATRAKSKP